MIEITQEYLIEILSYNKENGHFKWNERSRVYFKTDRAFKAWNSKLKGKRAGNLNTVNYRTIRINKENHLEHRLVFIYLYGHIKNGIHIDHINNIRNDNRLKNLRIATPGENSQNLKKCLRGNTSGLLGVSWSNRDNLYISQIKIHGKNIIIGKFKDKNKAHEAYLCKKREIHPFGTL